MKYIAFIALALFASLFTIVNAQTEGCDLKPGLTEEACDTKTKRGCPVAWVGLACCKNERNGVCIKRYDDGGCKSNTFCDFQCKTKCQAFASRGCRWKNEKCILKTPKPTKSTNSTSPSVPTSSPTLLG